MLRTPFFLSLAFVLAFAACTKQEVIVKPKNFRPPYRVSGLSDMVLNRSPFLPAGSNRVIQYLNIYYESGTPQVLNLSVVGLPADLKGSLAVGNSTPPFGEGLILDDLGVAGGTYEARLQVTESATNTVTNFPFRITARGSTGCAAYFAGKQYTAITSCAGNPTGYTVSVERQNAATGDTLLLKNILGGGEVLKATFNCAAQTIRVRAQELGNGTYTANGTITPAQQQWGSSDVLSLNVTSILPGGNIQSCRLELTEKQ